MYILEIFRKRRKFTAIFEKAWQLISSNIAYPPNTSDEPAQKLVFFGALAYGAVYQSALAAGMSTSAAHYLARMHMRKYKFENFLTEAVDAIFAASDDEEEQKYSTFFLDRIRDMVQTVFDKKDAACPADIEPAMLELSRFYRKVVFKTD